MEVGKVGKIREVGKVHRPWEVSHLLSLKFHVECRQSHVWGPPGARVMSISIKTYIFVKGREMKKGRERKKGREGKKEKGKEKDK